MNKKFETLVNEKTASILKTFTIANETMANAIATALVSTDIADNAIANKTESYKGCSGMMDSEYGEAWLNATWQAVKTGCVDLAAGYAKIAGEIDLPVNQVKELHQVYLAFTSKEIGGSRQTWQNIKEWSINATGPKAKHPEVKEAQAKAKAEAEEMLTPYDRVIKVCHVLVSQYQYLAKVEAKDDDVSNMMKALADILKGFGVDMEEV